MLFLSMIIRGMMILDAIRELVFRMSDVINVMAVFAVRDNFVTRALHGSVKMCETMCVSGKSIVYLNKGKNPKNYKKL